MLRRSARSFTSHETLIVPKLNGILRFWGKRAGRRNTLLNATNSLNSLHHRNLVVKPHQRYKTSSLRQMDRSSSISIHLQQCLPYVKPPKVRTALCPLDPTSNQSDSRWNLNDTTMCFETMSNLKGLRIAHFNIVSLLADGNCKIEMLRMALAEKPVDILCLNETRLSDNISFDEIAI